MAIISTAKWTPGESRVLALREAPRSSQGSWGPQMQYATTTGEYFWLDEKPAFEFDGDLRDLGIQYGEPFRMTKVKQGRGAVAWRVEKVGDAGGHNIPGRQVTAEANSGFAPATASAVQPRRQHPAEEQPHRSEAPSATEVLLERSIDMARSRQQPAAATPTSVSLTAAFMCAVDALAESAEYARRRGFPVTFTSEDLRCVAISVFIDKQRNGGAR